MKATKQYIQEFLCILLLLLWGYAAVSKWMDPYYMLQLRGSPIYGDYAAALYWVLPALELIIAILICTHAYRFVGLLLSFALLGIFTFYIIYLLYIESNAPCACGGLISGMTWTEHLLFNLAFLAVNSIALLLARTTNPIVITDITNDLLQHKGEAENLSE